MSDLQPHPHIVRVRVEKDEETGESVTIVTTDLNINSASGAYDKEAMAELTRHVEKWQQSHFLMVTIEGPV